MAHLSLRLLPVAPSDHCLLGIWAGSPLTNGPQRYLAPHFHLFVFCSFPSLQRAHPKLLSPLPTLQPRETHCKTYSNSSYLSMDDFTDFDFSQIEMPIPEIPITGAFHHGDDNGTGPLVDADRRIDSYGAYCTIA